MPKQTDTIALYDTKNDELGQLAWVHENCGRSNRQALSLRRGVQ